MFFVSWEMQYDENACTCGQLVIGSFITTRSPLVHHASCGDFGETSNHPGDLASTPTAQIWHPATSGFFQN